MKMVYRVKLNSYRSLLAEELTSLLIKSLPSSGHLLYISLLEKEYDCDEELVIEIEAKISPLQIGEFFERFRDNLLAQKEISWVNLVLKSISFTKSDFKYQDLMKVISKVEEKKQCT